MPGTRHSPINTTWNQSSQSLAQVDTSAWGVKYNHGAADQSQSSLKPPLPVRSPQTCLYTCSLILLTRSRGCSQERKRAKVSLIFLSMKTESSFLGRLNPSNTCVLLLTVQQHLHRYRKGPHRRAMIGQSLLQLSQNLSDLPHHLLPRYPLRTKVVQM